MKTGQEQRDRLILKSLIDALPEAAMAIDIADRVVAANAPARDLFPALRDGDLLARSLRAPDVLGAIRRARDSGMPVRAAWLERVPVERFFELSAALTAKAPLEPLVLVTLRDMTEMRRAERMRADFIANASHELRTPLASLLGFVETLQGPARDDNGTRERFLSIMREQAQRMARLVDDLLSLSRIEQSLHLRPQTPVDMASVLRHIADTLTPMAAAHEVVLKLDLSEQAIVAGDRDELLRLAENLIENAIKYGASHPQCARREVEIALKAEPGQCILTVRDHGPGIAPEHLPRLTERFYRVDAGQSRAKGGTGLGLAIVKHIVARHRGRLDIESKLTKGAIFRVSLPLHG